MKHFAPGLLHGEVVAAARWLIVDTIDPDLGIAAIEKRADRTVTYEKHVPFVTSAKHGLYLADNTLLSVPGALPSANARVWMSKELVSNGFEFFRRKKAGSRSIILVH